MNCNASCDVRKTYRFAILGCGMIAQIHAAAIDSLPDAELIGCADAFPAAAQRFAEKYGIRAYADEAELLGDENVDVVCICTPSHCHADSAIRALEHGKHVALEILEFLRPVLKFASLLEVREQVEEDILEAKKILLDRGLAL